jgi:hypothetical protein
MKKVFHKFCFLLALSLLSVAEAYGCDCMFGGGAVCQDYWKAAAVFVGTVIDSKVVTVKRGDYDTQQRLVRLSLDETFRGVEGAQVEILTGMGGGDCGFGFKQTQQYLVYAVEFEGKLYTGICNRTKEISKAAADLAYMRVLKNAKAGGAVYGEVTANKRDEKGERVSQPARAKIIIDGPELREISTDAKGAYRVDGLPAGDYTVKIVPPEGMTTGQTEQKISLANGGCAVVGFSLVNDGRLSGRVINAVGLPVNKAEIFLIESGKERYQGHWDAAYSDEEGRYAFKRIPPGPYILSIRFDGMTSQNRPFPITYYPGVSDRAEAKIITIGEGQAFPNYDLQMPPLPLEFEISGVVVWPNGKPAVGARVGYTVIGDAVFYGAKDEGNASFSIKAYQGLTLTMRASIEPEKGKTLYSDWVNVTVNPGLPQIKIVMPQP